MDSDGNCEQVEQRLVEERWRVPDVRFRFLIDPERGPLPDVWCLEVAPNVLLQPAVPRPDGRRMHELLTRHVRRDPGCLVYLHDMTDELDLLGLSWWRIGVRWQWIVDTLAELAADRRIPAGALWVSGTHTTVGS